MERLAIGCMSGTSLDGLDVALVRARGVGRGASCVGVVVGHSVPLPAPVSAALRGLAEGAAMTAQQIADLARKFSELHVEALQQLLALAEARGVNRSSISLVAVHGQTVFHCPPLSWQLINPTVIAHGMQLPVVFDLRAADLCAGGQGAPITPLSDWVMFSSSREPRACVINLGGFCNVTLLAEELSSTVGFDVCACNQLLDSLCRESLGLPYDDGGAEASSGTVDAQLAQEMEAYLLRQLSHGRSLGSAEDPGVFARGLWRPLGSGACGEGREESRARARALLASGCAAVAAVICRAVESGLRASGNGSRPPRCIIAGGGTRNAALVAALQRGMRAPVVTSSECGVDPEFREAAAMAVLGLLCLDGEPITLSAATRCCEPPVAGCWSYPTRPRGNPAAAPPPPAAATAPAEGGSDAPDRSSVLTEQRYAASMGLHAMTTRQVIAVIQDADADVPAALAAAREDIVAFTEALIDRYCRGGRLIYLGCGTSGRLGVLDASEVGPTFNVEPGRVVGIIAGGDGALRVSSEGSEDEPGGAVPALLALALRRDDTLLGIAAGGSTPYVLGGLEYAASAPGGERPLVALLSCSPVVRPAFVDHVITVLAGPEVVTGSSRMKAGTATKLCLNAISTALFVRCGKVFENLMVDLRATNSKLRDRAARIVGAVIGTDRGRSFELLAAAEGSCKLACILGADGGGLEEARQLLHRCDGHLGKALELIAAGGRQLFDLASLTKTLVTAPLVVRHLSLDADRSAQLGLQHFCSGRVITARQLLSHSSGLPPWLPYLPSAPLAQQLADPRIAALLRSGAHPLLREGVAGVACYSDLGMHLLAQLLEQDTGRSYSSLAAELYEGDPELFLAPWDRAATEHCLPTQQPCAVDRQAWLLATDAPPPPPSRDLPHDCNARAGMIGHAGLCTTASGFLRLLLRFQRTCRLQCVFAAEEKDSGARYGYGLHAACGAYRDVLARAVGLRGAFVAILNAAGAVSCLRGRQGQEEEQEEEQEGREGVWWMHTGFTGPAVFVCLRPPCVLGLLCLRTGPAGELLELDALTARRVQLLERLVASH